MTTLAGKTAVVTSASRGMGRAIALSLAKHGAQVIVHYCHSQSEADGVVKEIRTMGGRALSMRADLSTQEGTCSLAKQAQAIIGARLDILVANTDVSIEAPIEAMSIAEFDRLVALNVRAPYFLVQKLSATMCRGSAIILMSSIMARAVVGDLSAYAATKGAIDTLVKHFAGALGDRGIRVNAVAPGITLTGSTDASRKPDRATAFSVQALQRLATPEDVASVVSFLASDDARWITGDTVCVDGGSML